MKEKIEKAKAWFKKNWVYVTAGAATAGVIVVAVVKGLSDGGVIDPIIIDKAKEDWMDQLKTYEQYSSKGKLMTVREACAALDYNELVHSYLKENGTLTKEMEKQVYRDLNEKGDLSYIKPILEKYGTFFITDEK